MKRHYDIRCERGQTMAEFAVVLPVLLLLVFAVAQFGITFNNYVTLTDAVRSGARVAAVSRLDANRVSDTQQKVIDSAGGLNLTTAQVTVSSATWAHGDDVQVTATYPYSISLFGLVVKSGNLTSTTTERVE
jgi:Flp pilus assembly protein TadG